MHRSRQPQDLDGMGAAVRLMKLPMVALHYVLTEDKASFDKSVAYLKWLAGTANWSSAENQLLPIRPRPMPRCSRR